jgi:hypothetical protein
VIARVIVAAALFTGLLTSCRDAGPSEKTAPSLPLSPLHQFSKTLASYDPGGYPVRTETKVEGWREYFEHDVSEFFQTARCDTDGYTLKIPNGRYHVFLNFAEIQYDAAEKRVFAVIVQGQPVAERLDIFAIAGKNRGYQIISPYVQVADGLLHIEFRRIVGEPCVAYISVGGDIDHSANQAEQAYFQHIDSGAAGGDYGL